MPRHHDDESAFYQLPPDPLTPTVPPLPRPARAGIVTPPSAAVSTTQSSDATLQERAYTLYCQGLRSDTIAARLRVPARTVRRWLHRTRKQLVSIASDEHISELRPRHRRSTRRDRRRLGSLRARVTASKTKSSPAITTTSAARPPLLPRLPQRRHPMPAVPTGASSPRLLRSLPTSSSLRFPLPFHTPSPCGREARGEVAPGAATTPRPGSPFPVLGEGGQAIRAISEEFDRPRRHSSRVRYLAVIIAAQREIARLEALYDDIAQQPVDLPRIVISRRPDGPEHPVPSPRPRIASRHPAIQRH